MFEKVSDPKYKNYLKTVMNTAGLLLAQVKSHMDSALRQKGLLRSQLEKGSIADVVHSCVEMM